MDRFFTFFFIPHPVKSHVVCPGDGGVIGIGELGAEDGLAATALGRTDQIEGVVLLSADRHRSDLLVTRRPRAYDLYEFTSSKLTNHHTHRTIDEKDGALFSYNKKCSFGLVTIDTTLADPEITYQIITLDNELIHTFRLWRSQLRA